MRCLKYPEQNMLWAFNKLKFVFYGAGLNFKNQEFPVSVPRTLKYI